MSKVKICIFGVVTLVLVFLLVFAPSKEEPRRLSTSPRIGMIEKIAISSSQEGVEYRLAKDRKGNCYIVPVRRDSDGSLEVVGEPKRIE